jgi:hypothetical protein
MTIQEMKKKEKRSLIVICTLGLAAIPFMFNWESNIFKGTSMDNGGIGFILQIVSFLILSIPCVIIGFIYHFVRYFYYRNEIKKRENK